MNKPLCDSSQRCRVDGDRTKCPCGSVDYSKGGYSSLDCQHAQWTFGDKCAPDCFYYRWEAKKDKDASDEYFSNKWNFGV